MVAGKERTMPPPPPKAPKETLPPWVDWLPKDAFDPADLAADDDLITRDELLRRVQAVGPKIHPRTLLNMETAGLVPRPLRRWHEPAGTVRALYAPWLVDIVLQANELRRERRRMDELREEMRHAVMAAFIGHNMDRDSELRIPAEVLDRLRALAYRHTRFIASVAAVEVRFYNAEGEEIAGQRHTYDDSD